MNASMSEGKSIGFFFLRIYLEYIIVAVLTHLLDYASNYFVMR